MAHRLTLPIRGASLELPTFFPSVSSLKAPLTPAACVGLLGTVGYPQYLVSAYDYDHASDSERALIKANVASGGTSQAIALLDSGNYEAYWLSDPHWSRERFEAVAAEVGAPVTFSFDEQFPPDDDPAHIDLVVSRCVETADRVAGTSVVPIVHGRASSLPYLVTEIARQLQPLMVAVPERGLGDTVIERARTVAAIRQQLGSDTPLHLLGTGNPLSIAIFAAAGGDSFDGLEWSRASIDPSDGSVHHLSHLPLLRDVPGGEDALTRALVDNLLFLDSWMRQVRTAKNDDELGPLILDRLPPAVGARLRSSLPEVFA